ncbi:MAG: hypothetical protein Q9191_007334, partial [Dirinaria sp. TL-2023a]
ASIDEEWVSREFEALKGEYGGEVWCAERWVGELDLGMERKRKRKDGGEFDLPALVRDGGGNGGEPWVVPAGDGSERTEGGGITMDMVVNRAVCNPHDSTMRCEIIVVEQHFDRRATYLLPPQSTFLLSAIGPRTTSAFSTAALTLLPDSTPSAGPGQFDFVLLDPPWSNRSVRRSRRYSTMKSRGVESDCGGMMDPMRALGMLGQHIAPGGLVGCWITNKPAVREAALAAFREWGVELVEEWVWLKVTSMGQPVTELGGVWRKPYEVLMLGRKRMHQQMDGDVEVEGCRVGKVKKKLIVAVPDLHSRKPSLKELVEPLVPDPRHYRALEVFARNLTAGWWAWGDECLKYNWDGYWTGDA